MAARTVRNEVTVCACCADSGTQNSELKFEEALDSRVVEVIVEERPQDEGPKCVELLLLNI